MRSKNTVPRLWPGETAVVCASGPSLTRADVEYCRGKARVIVINTTYQLAPWADVLYACDARWWQWWRGAPEFQGLKFSIQREAGKWPGVTVLENTGAAGLEGAPTGLRNGRNSGYQAINLAVHFGVARIVLLGYDMQARRTPDAADQYHWHPAHPNRAQPPFPSFLRLFESLPAALRACGVTVVNATRETALEVFPRVPLEAAL